MCPCPSPLLRNSDPSTHALKLTKLPKQDNHCDCGLFLLTFVEFFCHAAPKQLAYEVAQALEKDRELGCRRDRSVGRCGRHPLRAGEGRQACSSHIQLLPPHPIATSHAATSLSAPH